MRLLVWLLLVCAGAHAQEAGEWKVYRGLLHAHSLVCDGSGTPQQAYATAKAAGLDFFALTPHNHKEAESGAAERKDGVLIANDEELYNGTHDKQVVCTYKRDGQVQRVTVTVSPVMAAAAKATDKHFVALYGQEFSSISAGNHVNVLGVKHVLHAANGDFSGLLGELSAAEQREGMQPVIQLNHPDVTEDLFYKGNKTSIRSHMDNDYGIDAGDLGPAFATWASAMGRYTHLIELLSGPAMARERDTSTMQNHENDYYFYLTQGIRLSPSAGQDNHYPTWGWVNDIRTGILAKELTEKAVYDALRHNRTFATSDKNLLAIYQLDGRVMGSEVPAAGKHTFTATVQLQDGDEPTAEYEVQVYCGRIAPQVSTTVMPVHANDGLLKKVRAHGNGRVDLGAVAVPTPGFCYIKVVQNGSDVLWTAPVWTTGTATTTAAPATKETMYYWSVSSQVYHTAGCRAIATIKPANLRNGTEPPAGSRAHRCSTGK